MTSTQRLIRPLDDVRRTLWRWSARTRLGRACLRDRSLRLAVLAVSHMATALVLTLVAPLWLLLLGPIVLGVPHIASDIRYLIARPIFPMRKVGLALVLTPLLVMTTLRVVPYFTDLKIPNQAAIEVGLGALAIVIAVTLARTSLTARSLFLALALGLGVLGVLAGHTAALVVAHLHNFVAFFFWIAIYRSEASLRRVSSIAGVYLGITALIFAGVFDDILWASAGGNASGLDFDYMASSVATHVDAVWAMRLVASYAFGQAMHYVIWIRLVPQRMDPRPAPPTFARTLSRLVEDFGKVGFALIALLTIATPVAALCFDALDVRLVYLLFIVAHGWLELSVFAAIGAEAAR